MSPVGPIGFAPDGTRALRLDARMRERLGDSLRYVLEQAGDRLPPPEGLDAFLARLAAGPVDTQAFGAYYELVLALDAGDLASARSFLTEVATAPSRGADLVVRPLSDPEVGGFSRRYRRLVDTDPSWPLVIGPPDPREADATRVRIADAFDLLDAAHPELAAELRGLLGEIVLARAEPGGAGEQFDGVSCFMLWGGLVLRAGGHESTLEMVEALAHEGAHNLLFGLATDGPLVANDDRERFASPLRSDPRPLDGIYHATFVTARMHHALTHLLSVGALDAGQRAAAEASLEAHVKHFDEGIAVVDGRMRLTEMGTATMQSARDYMRRA
ncbi:MAG: aKG-HExxH-type peptide beta-hydroxylase [Myxococcota bacterium]